MRTGGFGGVECSARRSQDDLLSRLEHVIEQGEPVAGTRARADWEVSGTYYGESAWDHVQVVSRSSGFSLKVVS